MCGPCAARGLASRGVEARRGITQLGTDDSDRRSGHGAASKVLAPKVGGGAVGAAHLGEKAGRQGRNARQWRAIVLSA